MVSTQRSALSLFYVGLLIVLTIPALALSGAVRWPVDVTFQAALLVLIPAGALLHSVLSRAHNLAWSVYWTWSLVFLGLASAYQLTAGKFPWGGLLPEEDVSTAQQIVILGHGAAIAAYATTKARRGRKDTQPASPDYADSPRLISGVTTALLAHSTIALLFSALMGTAMVSGRSAFQAGLAANSEILGFGSLYFLSNAGAIILPAMGILLRKKRAPIPMPVLVLSVVASFIATNPMIGSRFLTGSFLVAVTAALVSANARRWMPAGIIIAFVTVFPTLDLLRGDGTGATEVTISAPAETLTTFDYDAFEMLTREVTLHGELNTDITRTDLAIAPFLRWVPILSDQVQGNASGPVVATSTGMGYTNVSMPLWGEAHLIGSWPAVVLVFAAMGYGLGKARRGTLFGTLTEIPVAALLFIVLRGSLYEVLGYVLLAVAVALVFARLHRKDMESQQAAAMLELAR